MENTGLTDPLLVKVIRWTARIISLLAILIVLFFMISEALTEGQGKGESTPFINIVMGIIMLGGLGIAWKWELTGALISILGFIGVMTVPPGNEWRPGMLLFNIPQILFLICWLWSKLIRNPKLIKDS